MNALMTDRYELTMLQSFIDSGKENDPAVFETFTRRLPQNRRYGVFAGLGRLIPMIENFRFDPIEVDWLREQGAINLKTASYLKDFKFTGTIRAYSEGEIFFPNSPVLTVKGKLGECILLETLILSVLNFDSAIATTAARMVSSALGRPLIEMGSRRVNEDAAVAAARAAYIAGFDSTSNLLAGMRHGIPTVGTAAHAFTLAHETEIQAFAAQVRTFGTETTLLVDTYDIEQGIRNAIAVAGPKLRAIRIDSGDLEAEAHRARNLLDSLGAHATKITVTSDLDEYVIKDLRDAPINGYGVGTKLVASQPMGFVYKLVQINGRKVQKKSKDKVSIGGEKWAFRVFDAEGKVADEVFSTNAYLGTAIKNARPLQTFVVNFSSQAPCVPAIPIEARIYHGNVKDELPMGEQRVWAGDFGPFLTAHPYEGK